LSEERLRSLLSERISLPSTVLAATSMPASPSEAAVEPPLTSATFRFEVVAPVSSMRRMVSPCNSAVTLIVSLLLMASSTSFNDVAVDRSIVADMPLRSVMRILPRENPSPPLIRSRSWVLVRSSP